jgi:hypothetical protein
MSMHDNIELKELIKIMDISKFLSKVIGLYLIIVCSAMLINMNLFIDNVNGLMNNPPLLFISGLFTLLLGLFLVVCHNIWQWNWRVIITIFAWIALLKGISLVMYPQFMDALTLLFVKNTTVAYIAAGVDLALGVLLCYFGFKR